MILDFPNHDRLAAAPKQSHDGPCWIIWSTVHNAYWRAESKGYTEDVNEAGRYTRDVADQITLNGGRRRAGFSGPGPYEIARLAPEVAARASTANGQVHQFR